jgi:hypothetical protein
MSSRWSGMQTFFARPRLIGTNVLALLFLAAALALPAAASAAPLPLVVTPSPVSFPATTLGEKSSLQVDVFNEGDAASIEKFAIEGTDPGAFAISNNNCQVALAEGQHCTLTIEFQPAGAGGAKQATVAIGFTGGERAEESFELTGTAVSPQLSISPPSFDFGLVPINSGSSEATFTVENTGGAAVRVNGVNFEGNTNGYGFDSGNCNNRLLQPAETCTIRVFFFPNEPVPFATTLRVDVSGASFTAAVSGEGVRPEIRFAPNPASFGLATVGSLGSTGTITVSNVGRIPTGFFIAVISGGDAGSFRLLDESCTERELQPGADCSIHIRFAPLSAGAKRATLSVFDEGEGGMRVPLSGEGVSAAVTLTPSSHNFGRRVAGTRSRLRSFLVRNDGGTPIALGAASLVGANPDQFSLAGDECTDVVLVPGAGCQVRVRFAPSSRGRKAATLRIASDGGAFTAALTGTGNRRARHHR